LSRTTISYHEPSWLNIIFTQGVNSQIFWAPSKILPSKTILETYFTMKITLKNNISSANTKYTLKTWNCLLVAGNRIFINLKFQITASLTTVASIEPKWSSVQPSLFVITTNSLVQWVRSPYTFFDLSFFMLKSYQGINFPYQHFPIFKHHSIRGVGQAHVKYVMYLRDVLKYSTWANSVCTKYQWKGLKRFDIYLWILLCLYFTVMWFSWRKTKRL